ncbi:MAG: hypothetical protein HY359_08155 [Candidatus Rokubacteria bacterium]|nr:hypothetical protein [Candidatus Rokubacteria bacterium]
MPSTRLAPVVLALALALAPLPARADVIHLKNGNALQVEGWRDVGDAIEFMMGGGIVRISKAEVQKIDGKPSRGDFLMYSSGVTAAIVPMDEKTAVTQMTDLLKQGEALFGQTVSFPEKAGAFRRLAEQWRGFEVPEPLRPTHARGEAAIQMAVEAFSADEELPDTKEKVDKAKTELAAVQDEVKKRGAPGTGGGQG